MPIMILIRCIFRCSGNIRDVMYQLCVNVCCGSSPLPMRSPHNCTISTTFKCNQQFKCVCSQFRQEEKNLINILWIGMPVSFRCKTLSKQMYSVGYMNELFYAFKWCNKTHCRAVHCDVIIKVALVKIYQ